MMLLTFRTRCDVLFLSLLTGMFVTVLGDATNVAFRLSALAGRDGRPDVLATDGYSYCIAGKSGSLPRPPGVMSRTFQIGQIESTWRGSSPSSRGANISSVAQR